MRLDVVIPVYNEGENIVSTLTGLRAHVHTTCRILICYDFEEDTTLPALVSHDFSPLEIVTVRNRGRGAHAAVLTGLAATNAEAVIVMPADDDFNSHILDRMVAKCAAGCDIVTASRFLAGGCMVDCPLLKATLVRLAAFSLHRLAGLPSCDPTSGFRLFSRRVLDTVPIESQLGFTYSLELLVKVHRLGWKVGEVPARWYERTKGQSRFRVFGWLSEYLKWYFYAFETRLLGKGPNTVRRHGSR